MSERIRRAVARDGAEVADLLLASRQANLATIPALVRTSAEVRTWVSEVVLRDAEVWVAVDTGAPAGQPALVAVLVLDGEWIDQLYVLPGRTGEGVGARLLEMAKHRRREGLRLWTFQTNTGALRFYRRHGFVEVTRTDGADNEERAPDVLMRWLPTAR